MRVAVISDTHFPGHGPELLPACRERLRAADLIIHAGDLADMPTLLMLRSVGPKVVAVFGNADDDEVRSALPATATVALPGLVLGITHNGGAEVGRLERLRRKFPECGGVIFGHSHIPLFAQADDGFFILNPGSAADRRRQPRHSMAEIELVEGRPPSVRFVAVDDPAGPLDPALIRDAW